MLSSPKEQFFSSILIAEKGFENVLLNGTTEISIRRYAASLIAAGEWPTHLIAKTPTVEMPYPDLLANMREFFKWAKGHGAAADFLLSCSREEMPKFIVDTLLAIQALIEPKEVKAAPEFMVDDDPFMGLPVE